MSNTDFRFKPMEELNNFEIQTAYLKLLDKKLQVEFNLYHAEESIKALKVLRAAFFVLLGVIFLSAMVGCNTNKTYADSAYTKLEKRPYFYRAETSEAVCFMSSKYPDSGIWCHWKGSNNEQGELGVKRP